MGADGGGDVEFAARAAYLSSPDALVLADLHAGRDRTSNVTVPLGERRDLRERLAALLDRFSPGTVVFAGDVLHAFSHLPDEAAETVADLGALVAARGADLVHVRGNHDTRLDAVAEPVDEHRLADGTVVCHGHEAPGADAPRYVVGHDHPAIVIEGRKRPCALYGPGTYRGADVLVLPAFTRLAAGVTVNRMRTRDFDSPLVREGTGIDGFRPLVYDPDADETLEFPPLGEFRRLL